MTLQANVTQFFFRRVARVEILRFCCHEKHGEDFTASSPGKVERRSGLLEVVNREQPGRSFDRRSSEKDYSFIRQRHYHYRQYH
jgi:hypothetical protein